MWDIWPRSAVLTLRAYLAEHCREFVHDGKPLDPADVQDWIVSQARSLAHHVRSAFRYCAFTRCSRKHDLCAVGLVQPHATLAVQMF